MLDHLFIPAIDGAGLKPIPPISKGTDVIHADIISNIQETDLLLVDMSTLNANVFFEFGIATAYDKKVCVVKDNTEIKPPFDTNMLNYHTYDRRLDPWILKDQIPKLTAHIKDTIETEKKGNQLWRYYGLSTRAELPTEGSGVEAALELMRREIQALRGERYAPMYPAPKIIDPKKFADSLQTIVMVFLRDPDVHLVFDHASRGANLFPSVPISESHISYLGTFFNAFGYNLTVITSGISRD